MAQIEAVKLLPSPDAKSESGYQLVFVHTDHHIFATPPTPASLAMGFPLVVYVLKTSKNLDNQQGIWLMIDPTTGFAPMRWKVGTTGDFLVAKADRSPLTVASLRAIIDYIHEILLSGEDRSVVESFYDKSRLDTYIAAHTALQKDPECMSSSEAAEIEG